MEIGKNFSNQFVAHGYSSRRNVDFYSFVKRCEKRISILTTNLGFIVNERLGGDTDKGMTLLQMIAQEVQYKPSGFSIRVLTLDPDSNFTNDRASDLGRDSREFREHMREDLETLTGFSSSSDCSRSLQIKTYDSSALKMTYLFDDYVIASVVSKSLSSRECVTYIHNINTEGSKETYERHFDNLWGSAKLVANSSSIEERMGTWRL